ncbi:MAG TPA: HD domain-containing phosphohydrolase [Vicinamibacterales bacterium]|nr:HD domain-containing phosphohydrolase [Vicinamibacterales bacterium]
MHSEQVAEGRRSNTRILVADDEQPVAEVLRRILMKDGHTVEVVNDGLAALKAVTALKPHVVLLDVNMPGMSGIDVCRRLKQDLTHRLTPVILVTGMAQREKRIEGLEAGADDFLSKPVDGQELLARVRSLVRMKRYTDDLDSAASLIIAMALLIEARDGNTEGHCHRMANYATALGRALNLDEQDLHALHRGGFLHDIGMLAIPDAVLNKSGPLNPEEYELMKSHTIVGDQLCGNQRSLEPVRPIIRHHHERYDGSGYPDGLKGDEIPLLAQIIGLVDVYDAVTTRRPYQGPHTAQEAIDILRGQVVRGWRRPDLVDTFAELVEKGRLNRFNG